MNARNALPKLVHAATVLKKQCPRCKMTKARLLIAVTAIAFGAGTLQEAHAQLVGNYGGQQADGTPVSISIGQFRGKTYITFVQVQADTTCRDGTTSDGNTFEAGFLQIVPGPIVTLNVSSSTVYIGGKLVFDNKTSSVSGVLFERVSKLAAAPAAPKKSTICEEKGQAFAAVLDQTASFDPKLMTWGDYGPR